MLLDLHGPELLGEQVSLEVRGCKGQRLRAAESFIDSVSNVLDERKK